jgi:hypothetical protein
MPIQDIVGLPTVQAINNYTCTQYPNNTVIADNGWICYQVSNHSLIASATSIPYYTDAELTKILICGGVLVLAVLLITYALYKWYMQRYYRWLRNQKIRDKMKQGTVTDDDLRELEMPLPGISKGLMFGAGALVIVAGLAIFLMP